MEGKPIRIAENENGGTGVSPVQPGGDARPPSTDTPLEKLHKGVRDLRAMIIGDAGSGALDVFHQAVEVVAGLGDGDGADGGLVPELRRIELGDRDIERGAQAVFDAAHNLALVLERVRRFDAEFEGQGGDHEHLQSKSDKTGFRLSALGPGLARNCSSSAPSLSESPKPRA